MDKPLRMLGGKTMLAWVLQRATSQCGEMILNANGDAGRFAEYNLPVVADSVAGFPGPLAGVLAAMDWAAENAAENPQHYNYIMSFAGDAPFIPHDLVARLMPPIREGRAVIACATSHDRRHPVFALWPIALRDDLRHALTTGGIRKIDLFTEGYPRAEVDFTAGPDPFFNINTETDLREAEAILRAG